MMTSAVLVCLVTAAAFLSQCSTSRLHYSHHDAKHSLNAANNPSFESQSKVYNIHGKRQVFNNYGELASREDDAAGVKGDNTDTEEDEISDEKQQDDITNKNIQIKQDDVKIQDDGVDNSKEDRGEAEKLPGFLFSEDESLELSNVSDIFIGRNKDAESPPEVSTAEGVLRGQRLIFSDVSYDSFIGIPYVAKPVRFQASKPHSGWSGIRNAVDHPDICTQRLPIINLIGGSEDCLYLNVATPSINATGLPILFVVHGGAFKFQTGNVYMYNPQMLMVKGDMIVISFNYRLGALGFVSTRTEDAPGNVGMKDIVQALRWVQRNIHKFGGDRLKVTLYGVSSGAAAVEFLLLSKMTKGLFRSIVIQSGSALNYINYQSSPLQFAFKLGKKLGEDTSDVKKLMEYLRNADADKIMLAADELDHDEYPMPGALIYVPSAEDSLPGEEVFLDDHPYAIMKSGDYIKVPSMIGFNDLEGADFTMKLFLNPDYLNTIDPVFEHILPIDLMASIYSHREKNEVMQYFRDVYFNGQGISNETIKGFVDLMGDQIFVNGIFRSIDIRLRNSDEPIYYWQFAFRSVYHPYKDLGLEGAGHADDINYLFKVPITQAIQSDEASKKTSQRLITLVSNFMLYGNPTPNITSLLPVTWYPIQSKETLDYLVLNDGMEMKQDPYRDRRLLWECMYSRRYGLID